MISKNQIKLIRQLEQKKYRTREGLFVAEGPKIVGELLKSHKPYSIISTDKWEGPTDVVVTEDELRKLSFLQHPQQVMGLFHLPEASAPAAPSGLVLALDGVQDPGNLGTIIRIADWFGISSIYCSADTADAWSPKVVQATMGSIARVPLYYIDLQDLLSTTTLPVYGTLLDGNNIYEEPLSAEGIIVMGNEGKGISPPIRPLIQKRLLIPDFRQGETAESLNVAIATAITCSEFRRRQ